MLTSELYLPRSTYDRLVRSIAASAEACAAVAADDDPTTGKPGPYEVRFALAMLDVFSEAHRAGIESDKQRQARFEYSTLFFVELESDLKAG